MFWDGLLNDVADLRVKWQWVHGLDVGLCQRAVRVRKRSRVPEDPWSLWQLARDDLFYGRDARRSW